jgi:segregation and condensation protein B
VRAAIDELNVFYLDSGRAFEIAEISGCFQLLSRQEYIEHIRRIHPRRETRDSEPTVRLSQSALETLAIIAYRQPVTRADIERIRGVGCDAVLRLLMERGTVAAVGKKLEVVGQPRLYGTTVAFLAEFGLGSLDELPLREDFIRQLAETDGQAASIPGQDPN